MTTPQTCVWWSTGPSYRAGSSCLVFCSMIDISYRAHLWQVSLRASSRLGLLRKASKYLCTYSRITTFHGFVRPLPMYAVLAWIGAAAAHLHQIDRIQRHALNIIGPYAILQSIASRQHVAVPSFPDAILPSRRHVAALSFLYKLLCMSGHDQLTAMVPPLQPPPVRTRLNHCVQAQHAFQLSVQLPLPLYLLSQIISTLCRCLSLPYWLVPVLSRTAYCLPSYRYSSPTLSLTLYFFLYCFYSVLKSRLLIPYCIRDSKTSGWLSYYRHISTLSSFFSLFAPKIV